MNFTFAYVWFYQPETLGESRKPHLAELSHLGIHKIHTHTHIPQTSTSYLGSFYVFESHPSTFSVTTFPLISDKLPSITSQ